MNWEVVMWLIAVCLLVMSFIAWIEVLRIPIALYSFIDWDFRQFFFLIAVPILFVIMLIGKFW